MLKFGLVAFALPLIGLTPRPANADPITVGAVYEVVTTAYEIYQDLAPLLGLGNSNSGLADAINSARTAILNEVYSWEDTNFKANALSSMQAFHDLQFRSQGDPANPATWNTAIENARTTLNFYEVMVNDMANVDQLYALAPTYAALLATHAGLTSMKDDIFPGYPATWHETNERQALGIQTLNQLVGSPRYMCDPGFNPGAGNYNDSYAYNGVAPNNYDSPSKSRFWSKLENGYLPSGTWTGTRYAYYTSEQSSYCYPTTESATQYCNPITGDCQSIPLLDATIPEGQPNFDSSSCPSQYAVAWPLNNADKATALDSARGLAAYYYGTEEVVSLLEKSMAGILSLGGGNYPDDEGSLSLPGSGRQVDPTITEASCSNTGGVAYPMIDVPALPNPQPFGTGYLVPGDGRNFFPDQQVRITNQTAYEKNVARTAIFDIPGPGAYTLVLRYNTASNGTSVAKVGLQSGIDGGTLLVISNTVHFPATSENWRLVRLDFDTNYGWPSSFYARLQYTSGGTNYLDAAWLETR